jgi:hypothetical protein
MASLLSRFVASFDAIKPVPNLTGLDGEFNQLEGASGCLNGNSTAFKLLVKTSDATDPPVDCDQIGAGVLARWKQNGSTKVSISNAGLFTMTNTAVNTGFNADQVDGVEGANIAQIGSAKIPFSLMFRVEDPSTYPLTDDTAILFVRMPAINTAFLTKIVILRTGGTHTAGGSVTFKARIFNGSTIGSGVAFSDTNNLINTPYTDDFTDTAVAEGNFIGFHITARSGTITETKVNICVEGYQTIKA